MSPGIRRNDFSSIRDKTYLAYRIQSDDLKKLSTLQSLNGVDIPIAATILHFLQPDMYPLFDRHVKASLSKAGKWRLPISDGSENAWIEYVNIMRDLARDLGVSLRDLDKALWMYNRSS